MNCKMFIVYNGDTDCRWPYLATMKYITIPDDDIIIQSQVMYAELHVVC